MTWLRKKRIERISIMEISRRGIVLPPEAVAAMDNESISLLRERCTATVNEDGFSQVPLSVC